MLQASASAAKVMLVPEISAAAVKKTFGSMTLQPVPGHRKQTLVVPQDTVLRVSALAAKAILVQDMTADLKKTFGSMTLPAMPGHRKQTLAVREDTMLRASALAAKVISELDMTPALK